jgi:protein tyrosine phosphatase (PTP) superfamily phosphohydrolase (DUF442 family)
MTGPRLLAGMLLLLVGAAGSGIALGARLEADGTEPTPAAPGVGDGKAGPCKEAPAKVEPAPVTLGEDLGQMHNVHRVSPRFVRGSQPEVEDDFRRLKELGIKVVVSVDGAQPNVVAAHKHGLRYVHVPIGYGGLSREEQVLLYKAFTSLEGPFYVHCHHGKHRGPAACGVGLMAVEGWTAEQVTEELKRAGTAPKYDGLYAAAREFVKPSAEELAATPAELPEVTPVAPFQQAMVRIDQGWERLREVRQAAWGVPSAHPDVSPRHEAVILAEQLRELARRDEVKDAAVDFRREMTAGETAAWDLATALEQKPVDAAGAERAFERVRQACVACHSAHRD